jgi:hypothetical protein
MEILRTANKEIFVFPDARKCPSYHLDCMISGVSSRIPVVFTYITARQVSEMTTIVSPTKSWVFFHWPETLYSHFLPRNLALMVSSLPGMLRKFFVRRTACSIINNLREGLFQKHSVAFYFHDRRSFHRIPVYRELDDLVRPLLYKNSRVVFFAELSAAEEVYKVLGKRENVYIAPLGDYQPYHGPKIDRMVARSILGVPQNAKVILAIGSLRGQRQLKPAISAIQKYPNLFLLAGGPRHTDMRSKNIFSVNGYIDNATMNQMISASDYLLHTGRDYLTSASVRVAISYGLPVLAEPFGATVDMCRGAMVPIDNSRLEKALKNLPDSASQAYKMMVAQATVRNQERSWESSNSVLAHVFQSVY